MKGLARDSAGRPIPFFVGYPDGETPDFRTMDGPKLRQAIIKDLCWVCGERLLRRYGSHYGTFVAGPMCLVNLTSAEPPSHHDCALWSARACPFLANPNKVRRETGMEGLLENTAGIAIARNPGVTALIECSKWEIWNPGNGLLFRMKQVSAVRWLAHGEEASVKQVMESIETGLPALHQMSIEDGHGAEDELKRMVKRALGWVPDWDVALNTGDYPLTAELAS